MTHGMFIGPVLLLTILSMAVTPAAAEYSPEEYAAFLEINADLSPGTLAARYTPEPAYHLYPTNHFDISRYAWLDSVITKWGLTDDEIELLSRNGFMVTDRVNSSSAVLLLHKNYGYDLPVFISTDAILQALYWSFEETWQQIETRTMKRNLSSFLAGAYDAIPILMQRYAENPELETALADADLYITIARALLEGTDYPMQAGDPEEYDTIMAAIASETMSDVPLFSERPRSIDFSQFIPRGRYDSHENIDGIRITLQEYFRAMMWLGRMEFYLTPPPENPWEPAWTDNEIRRMCMGAMMVNELIDLSAQRSCLEENERIIDYLVGESDNCTPAELATILDALDIEGPEALLDAETFAALQSELLRAPQAKQQILSNILMVNPYCAEPTQLPVSYRIMGQRFVVDSYILSNVVYDRIVRNNKKIWRPLPNPLDVLYAIGNDDASFLLRNELEEYQYAPQLASLRYLVDSYDQQFWDSSIYNRWLSVLKTLNPAESPDGLPEFATTAAWHQQKLNTQLASWAQLRHTTILYASQPYTIGSKCSFPHSYVEPYPAFFHTLASLGTQAAAFFGTIDNNESLVSFYTRFAELTTMLAILAEKELTGVPFTSDEELFCKQMLFYEIAQSGKPPFTGWYAELFYNSGVECRSPVIADVHTQPTDLSGNPVGNILHVITGRLNMAVVLADSPSSGFAPMAFVGPVLSYYELVTSNFDRMGTERWYEISHSGELLQKPDWVNIYCADSNGSIRDEGRILPTLERPISVDENLEIPTGFLVHQNTPNPFNPSTSISFTISEQTHIRVTVHDVLGRLVATLADGVMAAGTHSFQWEAERYASGLYFCRVQSGAREQTVKMLLMK